MISLVIDTILPGDATLGLPPASETYFDKYVKTYSKYNLLEQFLGLLQRVSKDRFENTFEELSSADQLNAINACKNVDVRLFADFVTNLFRAYYSDYRVLQIIGSGSIPPFPEGNVLEGDDWDILESVYERGKIYRPVKNILHEVE